MKYLLDEHELRQFAQEVAGRSSVPFMMEHPSMVMPEKGLLEGVNDCLLDTFGIKPEEDYSRDEEMVMTAGDEPKEPTVEERVTNLNDAVERMHEFLFGPFDNRLRVIERHPHLKNEDEQDECATVPLWVRETEEFERIWQVIKNWDISRDERGYSGATGSDVYRVLKELFPTKF